MKPVVAVRIIRPWPACRPKDPDPSPRGNRAEFGTVLDHAGGNLRNIGDFGAAKAECVARAHLLRFGGVGEA
jgi:hypothetical protein